MPSFIDSHAHIDGPEFDADRADVIARARAAGLTDIVVIGAGGDLDTCRRAIALAETDPHLHAAVAIHPHDVAAIEPAFWPELLALAAHPAVVAVGETGLDYHYDHSPRENQRAAFRKFIDIAREVQKPVVCHIRDAHADAQAILTDTEAAELGVVIHCFTGTPADARIYAEMGCYVSFSGIATFKSAGDIRDAVKEVPHNRLLLETDCPYLAPVPMRGRRNEPAFLVHTAEVIAREANLSVADLAAQTTANTRRIFNLSAD